MESVPLLVSTLVDQECFETTLVDTGCLSYGVISSSFVRKNNLERIAINPRRLSGFDGTFSSSTTEVAVVRTDINGHIQDRVFLYIVPKLSGYDAIMGLSWIKDQRRQIDPKGRWLRIRSSRTKVPNITREKRLSLECISISVTSFGT
jgi:predicted aspartyl protease